MEFEVFGIQADLDVRSHVAWSETEIRKLYEQIDQPCVILVTCHRFEIYSIRPIDQDNLDRGRISEAWHTVARKTVI